MRQPLPPAPEPNDTGSSATPSDWQPNVVALVCRWCSYAGADLAGTSRLTYPAAVRLVRLPCTGRMSPLFVIKAFEQGADGVLLSGCHPGDCHYVQGNLFARRRFALLKTLLEFVGLDPRRLHFSWVSASEGAKWVRVVEEVTAAVRAAGPARFRSTEKIAAPPAATELSRAAASPDELAALTGRLRQVVADLLARGDVDLVVGYKRGTLPGQVVPAFVDTPEQAEQLIWGPSCQNNLAAYLPRSGVTREKTAVVVKACDAASVVGLLQERQVEREAVKLIGVPCNGVSEGDRLADKCHTCDGRVPSLCDVAVATEQPGHMVSARDVDPRDEAIAYLDNLSPESRWSFWQEEFQRCLRCHACRAVCPLCYCETCIVDKHRPQWISPAIDETGNTAWNLIRALHLAGRCSGCDECARVCPAEIRLDLINRKLAREVEQRFDYRPGSDAESAPPLTRFREDDPEEFVL